MTEWFYDRQGKARLFLFESDRFISKNGRNLGWTFGNNVYSLIGMHIGWYESGILFDRNNSIIAFKLNTIGNLVYFPTTGGIPDIPRIPRRPLVPGLFNTTGRSKIGGWSNRSLHEMFGINFE